MANALAKIFGENVQRKRKLLGLTQEQLAELLGVSQHSLSRIERGVLTPKFERLQDFANHLHTPVSKFFIANDDKNNDINIIISDILGKNTPSEKTAILKIVSIISLQLISNRNINQ